MPTIQDFIEVLDAEIKENEVIEDYEYCALLLEKKNAILDRDIEKFVPLFFDIAAMKQMGNFIPKDANNEQIAERIRIFFGLETIFDYVLIGMDSKYHLTI